MIQHIVTAIGGIASFGIISILLFFAVFSGALVWALRLKKPFLNTMGALPLQDNESTAAEKGESHHD
jgi:hypothetical protein